MIKKGKCYFRFRTPCNNLIVFLSGCQEVQALLNATSSSLDLVLFNKRGTSEEARRRKHVAAASPQAPVVRVRAECTRLPLPASPEYIALKQTRQRRMSESPTNIREENEVSVTGIIFCKLPNIKVFLVKSALEASLKLLPLFPNCLLSFLAGQTLLLADAKSFCLKQNK